MPCYYRLPKNERGQFAKVGKLEIGNAPRLLPQQELANGLQVSKAPLRMLRNSVYVLKPALNWVGHEYRVGSAQIVGDVYPLRSHADCVATRQPRRGG